MNPIDEPSMWVHQASKHTDVLAEMLRKAKLHETVESERDRLVTLAIEAHEAIARIGMILGRSARKADIEWHRQHLEEAIERDREAEAALSEASR